MPPLKLHVSNLPDNCSKDSLQDLFGSYGDIIELDVIKNYAFVFYRNEKDAKNAVDDLNQTKILGQQIMVQVSKNQSMKPKRDRRDNHDNRDNREQERRPPPRNRGPPNGPPRGGPRGPPNRAGGILGSAPGLGGGPAGLDSMNIFSAVNTLAAVEQQQRNKGYLPDMGDIRRAPSPGAERYSRDNERGLDRGQPDPDVRVRRDSVHKDNVPNSKNSGSANGYVIYERYYVDPSHPLLNGLPIPELPRMTDTYVAQEVTTPRPSPYTRNEDRGFKDRSPLAERNDLLREREREYRSSGYPSADYYH